MESFWISGPQNDVATESLHVPGPGFGHVVCILTLMKNVLVATIHSLLLLRGYYMSMLQHSVLGNELGRFNCHLLSVDC